MKFTTSIEIALPRQHVVELLTDPANRPKWLKGLVSHEPLTGVDGHVGTESRVVFGQGKGTMECTETITRREPTDLRDFPDDKVVHFDREIVAEGMWSAAQETLSESSPGTTGWVSANEYRFSGPMRLIAPLMRRSFIKQTRQHMLDFKAFAEEGIDVREGRD
ncbi:SRPBCC family protein [Nocardioides sp. zg-1228]|uniref:SRPBCC family protein n=1 Tax=Nocardioides sp. zg-1228 TaxID=2763008 RepID=UPI001642EB8E|nr:SRPBCC family protein [Nocardioides sp. zg-1228]MBC2934400.1 SRPBCC family protein [Nocardioides sp. zg-1228]QSF59169.1 SRPBCC family protein [Nocardioides sp. zg-1228]